ncbi:MAG: hypothetical protein PHV68_07690 [Candidatus Gastranaerophilales bacterium]|nr:hypothetical protein [Candidatus Gastranaerophilales bacterium]
MLSVQKTEFFLSKNKSKLKSPIGHHSSFSSSNPLIKHSVPSDSINSNLKFNNSDKPSIPLNSNLSFEGFSKLINYSPKKIYTKLFDNTPKTYELKDGVEYYQKTFGKKAKEFLDNTLHEFKTNETKGILLKGDKVTFQEDTLVKSIVDSALYPVTKMPLDITNGLVKSLRNISFLKENQVLKSIQESSVLAKHEHNNITRMKIDSLRGYFEDFTEHNEKGTLGKLFKNAHNYMDPTISKYSTVAERSLVRLATGGVTAGFLANDAYNLTRMVNDDHKEASKEHKKRFSQEVSRLGLTVYTTIFTLGALKKYTNRSQAAAVAVATGCVLVSEALGRMLAGVPVLPISKKQAEKAALKENPDLQISQNTNETNIKEKEKENKNTNQYAKPLLILGGMIAGGFGFTKLKQLDSVKNLSESILKKYKPLVETEITIAKDELETIFNKLRKNDNFNGLADNYEKIIRKNNLEKVNEAVASEVKKSLKFDEINLNDETAIKIANDKIKKIQDSLMESAELTGVNKTKLTNILKNEKLIPNDKIDDIVKLTTDSETSNKISLGIVDKRVTKTIIENGLLIPFKVAEKIGLIPYKIVTAVASKIKTGKFTNEIKKPSKEINIVRNSIELLKKNVNNKDFNDLVNKNLLKSLDNTNRSNYSNSDLAVMNKLFCSFATAGFLIADSFNTVMRQTAGQDQDVATERAKHRAFQRIAQTLYSTYIIQFTNTLFKPFYDASLVGASLISASNNFMVDTLSRKSVGLPIAKSTKEEIEKLEQGNLNAKGIKGKYFKAMAFITGKKKISDRIDKPGNIKGIQSNSPFFASQKRSDNVKSIEDFLKVANS